LYFVQVGHPWFRMGTKDPPVLSGDYVYFCLQEPWFCFCTREKLEGQEEQSRQHRKASFKSCATRRKSNDKRNVAIKSSTAVKTIIECSDNFSNSICCFGIVSHYIFSCSKSRGDGTFKRRFEKASRRVASDFTFSIDVAPRLRNIVVFRRLASEVHWSVRSYF